MKIKVRFIGQFFLVFDDTSTPKTATVYLRASTCHGTKHQHVPTISFDPKFFAQPNFDPADRLHVSATGDSLASRTIPPYSILTFSGPDAPAMAIERTKDATKTDFDDLKIDLLPSLAKGGAKSLKTPAEIGVLSSVMIDFASIGKLACERVFRDGNKSPISWAYRDGNREPNKLHRQAIAEVLTWTADLKNLGAIINLNGAPWLELVSGSSAGIELIVSNLPAVPIKPKDNTLVDFPCLLDYANVTGSKLIPTLLGTTSTGGSVICPGARP